MKNKLLMGALLFGVIGGHLSTTIVSPAFAASNVIVIPWKGDGTLNQVAAKCDFSKTIVFAGNGAVCVQK